MEAIVFVVVAALAILAIWFGLDKRAGFRSSARQRADHGVLAGDFRRERGSQVAGLRIAGRSYPTLAFIEQALGGNPGALTGAMNASGLEVRAGELVSAYWSDAVWTTGIVSGRALDRVLAELLPSIVAAPAREADVLIPAERERAPVALVA